MSISISYGNLRLSNLSVNYALVDSGLNSIQWFLMMFKRNAGILSRTSKYICLKERS